MVTIIRGNFVTIGKQLTGCFGYLIEWVPLTILEAFAVLETVCDWSCIGQLDQVAVDAPALNEALLSRCQWSQWQHGQEIKVQHGDLFTDKSLDFQWIKLQNFQRYLLGTPYLWIDVNHFLDFWCNRICKQTCFYYSSTQGLMEYNLRLQWLKIDQKSLISQVYVQS